MVQQGVTSISHLLESARVGFQVLLEQSPASLHSHTTEGKWLMRFSDETFCPKTNRCSSSYILSLMKTGWEKIVWTQFMQTNSVFLYQGTASQRIWFLLLTLLKHKKTSTGKILGDFTISQEFMFPNLRSEPKEHFCLGLCVKVWSKTKSVLALPRVVLFCLLHNIRNPLP